MYIVMDGKINAYQREMYLHQADGKKEVDRLFEYMKVVGVNAVCLPDSYLKYLYLEQPDLAY